ncbi:hypothetical protein BU15DRAFT_66918 [Melanogaster broomeanus]|nr:hypothetical protein BU15DRAFT_66918 [Melanogaster broomeanus]
MKHTIYDKIGNAVVFSSPASSLGYQASHPSAAGYVADHIRSTGNRVLMMYTGTGGSFVKRDRNCGVSSLGEVTPYGDGPTGAQFVARVAIKYSFSQPWICEDICISMTGVEGMARRAEILVRSKIGLVYWRCMLKLKTMHDVLRRAEAPQQYRRVDPVCAFWPWHCSSKAQGLLLVNSLAGARGNALTTLYATGEQDHIKYTLSRVIALNSRGEGRQLARGIFTVAQRKDIDKLFEMVIEEGGTAEKC